MVAITHADGSGAPGASQESTPPTPCALPAVRELEASPSEAPERDGPAPDGTPAWDVRAATAGAPFGYTVFGLRLRSDLPLPIAAAPSPRAEPGDVDVTYSLAPAGAAPPPPDGTLVATQPCPVHGTDMLVHRGPGGASIWHRAIATCRVSADARRVEVYPEPAADPGVLSLLLAGQVAVFVLNQLGVPTLHASAAVTPHGAVAFLGPKGQGKSTMTAAFLKRGAALLTDDVLPLRLTPDGPFGLPSLPLMKLWPGTAEHTLELTDQLPFLMADYEKRLLRLDERHRFASAPAPLRAFYLLDRYDPAVRGETRVSSRLLSGREAITAVAAQLSPGAFLLPAEQARLLPFLAAVLRRAPARLLSFPDGFAHQGDVHDFVVQEIAALGAPPASRARDAGAIAS